MSTVVILWDCLFAFGGWCLYRNPRLLEKDKTKSRQVKINRIGGIVVLILGTVCAGATAIPLLMKVLK